MKTKLTKRETIALYMLAWRGATTKEAFEQVDRFLDESYKVEEKGYKPQINPKCDDGEDPYAPCETSVFHGRESGWYLLEWWPDSTSWAVYELPEFTLTVCVTKTK
jgi:hypothetical protein